MAADGPTVHAAVGTLRAGDRIYRCDATANPGGYEVLRVEGPYDDGTVVVVYRCATYGWDRGMVPMGMGEVSLRAMLPNERMPARRAE